MDDTGTGAVTGPEALSAQAARQLAEQKRAAARAQFETPSWIGPARTSNPPVHIPQQAEPEEDDLPLVAARPGAPIPDTATWSEKGASRVLAGIVLLAAMAGVVAFLVVAIVSQSVVAIAGLAACGLVAVIFRGALMSTGVTTVELKGSVMRIRKGGVLDVVNLADPVHLVQLVGTPGQPAWRLRLEAVDGRSIELGPKEVDAAEVHRIVEYYRAIAERDRRERDRRFNR
jgi:hypothetical protein